jgi:peroxiredoxin
MPKPTDRRRLTIAAVPVAVGALAALIAAGLTANADPQKPAAAGAAADAPKKPEVAEIDKPFRDFTFRDLAAEKKDTTVRLSDFKGKKTVVLAFMANRCGTTWQYEKRMGDFLGEYGKKDVAVLAVHSNYTETDREILGQIETRNLALPVLDDKKDQALKEYVGARVTPTFLVIDKKGVLRYKGAFDDNAREPRVAYLRPAVDAVLSGKEVAVKTSRPFG